MARHLPWLKVVHHADEPRLRRGAAQRVRGRLQGPRLLHRRRRPVRPARAAEALRGLHARASTSSTASRSRRSDPLHRKVIGRLYHTFVKTMFGLRLRDVDCDFRLMRRAVFEKVDPHALLGRHLRGAHEEGAGPRLPHRRGARAPLPPHLRQSQFFNFPRVARTLADLVRLWLELVVRKEHLRRRRRSPRPAARTQPRVSDHRDFYRGRKVLVTGALGFIGSNLCRTLADLGARGPGRGQPAARLRRQPLQPRRLRGQGPHQHRRRARPRHGVPGARPGGAVQPRRPGEPHRLHDRPLHRPRDQLPQPALDPGGGAQEQPRA